MEACSQMVLEIRDLGGLRKESRFSVTGVRPIPAWPAVFFSDLTSPCPRPHLPSWVPSAPSAWVCLACCSLTSAIPRHASCLASIF